MGAASAGPAAGDARIVIHDGAAPAAPPNHVPAAHRAAEAARRAAQARAALTSCTLCERRCGADRRAGQAAPCGLDADSYVFSQYLSVTEEPEVVPALRVSLAGCNLRCQFCDAAPGAFAARSGRRIAPAEYAQELRSALAAGVRTISVLGGEPTLHVHTLLELLAADPDLPLAINTNLYMTPEVLAWLTGHVRLYLADFKFGNDGCARRLAGVPNYVAIVRRNLLLAAASTPIVVRHLLLPGHEACCFRPVASWVAEHRPGVRFQLYTGYVPCWRAGGEADIGRLNGREEVRAAVDFLRTLDLAWSAGADGESSG